jgi:hypothetical protein
MKTAADRLTLRGNVKSHERKRIEGAFTLLTQRPQSPGGKTSQRREGYQKFLQQVKAHCGSQFVVVGAVGVGQSKIAAMKELDRLRLA